MHDKKHRHRKPREMQGSELADPIGQAAHNIGISRALAYIEAKNGRLRTFKVGRSRLVSREAQREYIQEREAETA